VRSTFIKLPTFRIGNYRIDLPVAFFFFLMLSATTVAQSQYNIQVHSVEHGLPQNTVNAILQSRDGYLWLGTYGGLTRFDGLNFVNFDVSNTKGLTSNRILSLCEDREGSLWIGTENQGLMRLKEGVFTSYPDAEEIHNRAVAGIIESRAGGLWMATATAIVRLKDGKFSSYSGGYGLTGKVVPWSRSLVEDRNGDLWVALNRGLLRVNETGARLYSTKDGLPNNRVLALCESKDGSLWVGTERGLSRLSNGSFKNFSKSDGLSDDYIVWIHEDRNGTLWFGTEAGGVIARNGEKWTSIQSKDGLSDDTVLSIADDREGNLWLGTRIGGLNRVRPKVLQSFTAAAGLPPNSIVPITQDRFGDIWIGATCGGLTRFHGNLFTTFTKKDGLPNDCVWALNPDRDGSLWIGTWGGGLTHLKDGQFTTYDPDNSGLSGRVVKALWQDRAGALWIGTDAGLNRFQDGKFTIWRTSDGLLSERINFITEDSTGALWISSNAGVNRFKDGVFTSYTSESGLSNVSVRVIYEDSEGTFWFGTYGGGLNRLKDGKFSHYGTHDGLFDDVVSQILEDDRGNLWMTGNKGIFRVKRQELNDFAEGRVGSITSVSYGVNDGMINRECNGGGEPAGWKARDGTLWFPTVKGPVVVDPNKITLNELVPPVVIEALTVSKMAVDLSRDIEISPGKGDLEIRYAALSFAAPDKVRFKYLLEGYDENWVEAGARRIAYYTNISPGRYKFRVIASNEEGVWNDSGATLAFYLRPHFYQTGWFKVLTLLSLTGIVAIAYTIRLQKLRRAHAVQQAFSRQLIEAQESERKRIAGELHDSVGQSLAIIRNLALVSLSDPDDHEQALEQLKEVSTAASEALVEVKTIAHNLRPYQIDRLGLSKALAVMAKSVGDSANIPIATEIENLDGMLSKEVEINLYRIVQEGLNNIVQHSGATKASLIVLRKAKSIEIEVRDNGKGFVPGNISDPAGGLGLIGIAERAKILASSCEIRSALGTGTTISLTAGIDGPQK